MVYGDRALSALHRHTPRLAAAIVIALQNLFAITTKIFFILTFEGVAGGA